MDDQTPSKIDLRHAESGVVFSFSSCSLKNYSFYSLSRKEATKLLKRLRHIEKLTWKQLAGLPQKNGLTPETLGSKNFEMIKDEDSSEQQLVGERYYFHFDPDGKINH